MLTNSIKEKEYIYSVCRTTGDIACGEVFETIKIEDDGEIRFYPDNPFQKTKIICCGNLDDSEKLFKTEDGQYYFGIKDGWGSEDGTLYGIRCSLYYNFGHPTTFESALAECDIKHSPTCWASAMKEHSRRFTLSLLKPFIQKLMENPGAAE